MAVDKQKRVVVVGNTYLGFRITLALLSEGADVLMLIREGTQDQLGVLESKIQWMPVDIWNPASLRGRARGHGTVINTIGSMTEDNAQGLSFSQLNTVSARNAANMCVSDGVSHFIMMSANASLWMHRKYIASKREAEQYVHKIGLRTSIIRAPIIYERGMPRPLFFRMVNAFGSIPPFNWLPTSRGIPLAVDILARAVARLAINPPEQTRIFYARDLKRLNSKDELRGRIPLMAEPSPDYDSLPFEALDEEMPFGWSPSKRSNEEKP